MSYVSAELRRQISEDAGHRCGYCRSDELLTGASLVVEHIIPEARGGATVRDNLWLACRECNEFKGARVEAVDSQTGQMAPLHNPRIADWETHFAWSADGTLILGLTPTARATVEASQLNRALLVAARRRWVMAGWHPPSTPSS